LEKFKFVQKSIEDEGDLSLPKLLIVRRDCAQNDESYFRRDEDFIEKVHETGIFDDSISSINLVWFFCYVALSISSQKHQVEEYYRFASSVVQACIQRKYQ
jgi:hypothetical protein